MWWEGWRCVERMGECGWRCVEGATFTFWVLVYLSPVNIECDLASQFMCADQAKCVDIHFCCQAIQFSRLCRGLRGENVNITGTTVSSAVCVS